ncbi:MAG: hypothetical protein M3214_00945 [Actinomycetota bacterium]|nr:hypothetical protein [Actinomycetota bacterium]
MNPQFHPSDQRLLRWAEGAPNKRTDRHMTRCGACTERLERLTTLDPADLLALRLAVTPHPGFRSRIDERLKEQMLNHETLTLISDLFGIAWSTGRLLLQEDDEHNG